MRSDPSNFRFRHIAHRLGSFQHSRRVVDAVQDRYGQQLAQQVPPGTRLRWHVDTGSPQQNDQWQAEHPGGGYAQLAPREAAEWALSVCKAWVKLLTDNPPPAGFIRAAYP